MKKIFLPFLLLLIIGYCQAQTITKLTITDNLSSSSKFGYGKPKPAPAKDQFEMIDEKGTQVLFYTEITPSETLPEMYQLVFTAYKVISGKDEWVDERLLDVKKTSTYALTAVNFFEAGQYKIVITTNEKKENILAQGNFTVLNQ